MRNRSSPASDCRAGVDGTARGAPALSAGSRRAALGTRRSFDPDVGSGPNVSAPAWSAPAIGQDRRPRTRLGTIAFSLAPPRSARSVWREAIAQSNGVTEFLCVCHNVAILDWIV